VKADDATLARLMALAQAGNQPAYRELLETSRLWLTRFFAGRVAPHAVDDLVQDTLVSVHRKRASYDPTRAFLPWLAAIARYRWVDHLRSFYRIEEDGGVAAEGRVDPFDDAVLAEISIDRMLAQLPDGQAAAIRLVKIDGYSIAEAAGQTGQSETLIKVNIHRGLKRLATHIESL
jgi:RNA polymerase sigma factor (sigma-70 family)